MQHNSSLGIPLQIPFVHLDKTEGEQLYMNRNWLSSGKKTCDSNKRFLTPPSLSVTFRRVFLSDLTPSHIIWD